jgi:hypothetical protein
MDQLPLAVPDNLACICADKAAIGTYHKALWRIGVSNNGHVETFYAREKGQTIDQRSGWTVEAKNAYC